MNAQKMNHVKSVLNSYFPDSVKGTFLSAILGEKTDGRVKPVKTGKNPSKRTDGAERVTIDSATIGFLREGFITIPKIVEKLESGYPELIRSDSETLTRTTKRRVTSYLKKEKGITGIVRKNVDGVTFYFLPESESEKAESNIKKSSLIIIP